MVIHFYILDTSIHKTHMIIKSPNNQVNRNANTFGKKNLNTFAAEDLISFSTAHRYSIEN